MALGAAPRRRGGVENRSSVVGPAAVALMGHDRVEVRRSTRRRRTVSAYRSGDRVVVLLPARLDRAEEQRWVDTMVTRLARREARIRPGDRDLEQRARDLSARHLGGAAVPASVRWTDRQNSRWGSCTPSDRTIRVSSRLRGVPAWVLDYVLVHELAHLLEASHDARFWALVDGCPRSERAQGFLEGLGHAAEHAGDALGPDDHSDVDDGPAETTGQLVAPGCDVPVEPGVGTVDAVPAEGSPDPRPEVETVPRVAGRRRGPSPRPGA